MKRTEFFQTVVLRFRISASRTGNASGHVLVLAVMVTALVFVLGSSALVLGRAGARSSFDHRDKSKVYYIAEAGVEKALARAKWDAGWLWGLPLNTEVSYLSGEPYGGGVINSVKVKKESTEPPSPGSKENLSSTTIVITSTGQYQKSRKTLRVRATVGSPLNYKRGVWVKSSLSVLGEGSRIITDVFADGNIEFGHSCSIAGSVTAGGNISVRKNVSMTAVAAVSGGSVILCDGARLDSDVRARGSVTLNGGALIGSESIQASGPVVNWRHIYYNGTLFDNSGRLIDPSRLHPGQAGGLVLPQFPLVDLRVFENTYDLRLAGDRTFNNDPLTGAWEIKGIYLIDGNIRISGTYRGVGALVARGDVVIDGDLQKYDSESSLLIASYGGGVTIGEDRVVNALLYAPPQAAGNRKVALYRGAILYGSVICDVLEMGADSQLIYDDAMAGLQPEWFTSTINFSAWEEEIHVF